MTGTDSVPYCGRFAPSPSGPLHFGSIVAALASYLDARHAGGQWLVRIDDIDTPRVRPGATSAILHALERLGLEWDESVSYQSRRLDRYDAALEHLRNLGCLYACDCPRRLTGGQAYPGTCRERSEPPTGPAALRVCIRAARSHYHDLIQGDYTCNLARTSGDFIVRRADGLHAYHLATALDDVEQGMTHVIRGVDLMDSTPRQYYLQELLGFDHPAYGHFPVAVDCAGNKISKSSGAVAALLQDTPARLLQRALVFLGQSDQTEPVTADPRALLDAAIKDWNRTRIPRVRSQTVTDSPEDLLAQG